jgi:hypothetical protein
MSRRACRSDLCALVHVLAATSHIRADRIALRALHPGASGMQAQRRSAAVRHCV